MLDDLDDKLGAKVKEYSLTKLSYDIVPKAMEEVLSGKNNVVNVLIDNLKINGGICELDMGSFRPNIRFIEINFGSINFFNKISLSK